MCAYVKIYFSSLGPPLLITDVKCLLLTALDTWRKDVQPGDIKDTINEAAPDKIKSLAVSEVFSLALAEDIVASNMNASDCIRYRVID